ncbi:MAG TPA: hypothetical protein VG621_00940 [Candidatus Paceibacterota bacterium]|nr:hypothetical protein [Candidatus Paceibacterota bacterium]
MQQKKVLPVVISLAFGILLSVGLSYATSTWTAPSQTPPSGNLPPPVNEIVNGDQIKNGDLSVDGFIAAKDAQFDQELFLNGIVRGGVPGDTSSTVHIGGKDTSGVVHNVTVNVEGNVSATDYIRSSPLSNTQTDNVCATASGTLVLCSPSSGGGGSSGGAQQYYASCFVAGTQVTLANGTKENIEDVKVGDVLKGDTTNNVVVGFHRPLLNDDKLYAFNGGSYFVTAEHPFMTTEGWKSIDPTKTRDENIGITVTPLHVGDRLVTDHGLVTITTIESKSAPANTQLYNFFLTGDHTYYADGYLVHNKAQCNQTSLQCSYNTPCIDINGYPITDSSDNGTCAVGCVVNGKQYPFCKESSGDVYCPNSSGQC